jgi:GPI mannosyltransferase 3
LGLSALFDRAFYEQWVFPPLRFLHFNIVQSLAVFYGHNDWHYYLSQGYPLLLTTLLPFALTGLYQTLKQGYPDHARDLAIGIKFQLAVVALAVPFILSFISHKEVRFIYPLLPMLHVLAAQPFAHYFLPAISATFPLRGARERQLKTFILAGLLTANVLIAIFATRYHQTAPLTVMEYLRHEHEIHYLTQPPAESHLTRADTTMTVGFLMPCHSTPWRSHLVSPGIKAWALGCEPPIHLNLSSRAGYRDEADQFHDDPKRFLYKTLGKPPRAKSLLGSKTAKRGLGWEPASRHEGEAWDGKPGVKPWPEYLVFFEAMEHPITDVVKAGGYAECWRGWNAFFHDDWRRRGDIVVWCLRGSLAAGHAGSWWYR